jgi:hypothetical protein
MRDDSGMYERRTESLIPFADFVWRVARHVLIAVAMVAASMLIGMAGYMRWAHMRWVDAFLNSAMLLGGMGPVGDLPNDTSKIFSGMFALYAGLVFIAASGVIITPIAHRVLHKLHVEDVED